MTMPGAVDASKIFRTSYDADVGIDGVGVLDCVFGCGEARG